MAAAMPPSAITVCALPSRDFDTMPTLSPRCLASMAARRPAPPAPMISTSYSWCSYCSTVQSLEKSVVGDGARGHETNVDIGAGNEDQRGPGKVHVLGVEWRDELPELVTPRVGVEALHL